MASKGQRGQRPFPSRHISKCALKDPGEGVVGFLGFLVRVLRIPAAICIFTGILYCTPSVKRLETRDLILEKAGGETASIRAEIARTDEERAVGLMHRLSLPDGEGMLFVFDRDRILSFWMKDTLIPLSIAFIAYNGRILEIRDMQPQDLSAVRSSRAARYALEVPQGWFDRAGVKAGDILLGLPAPDEQP